MVDLLCAGNTFPIRFRPVAHRRLLHLRKYLKKIVIFLNIKGNPLILKLDATYAAFIDWCWMGYNVSIKANSNHFTRVMGLLIFFFPDLLLDVRILAIPDFRNYSVAQY